MATPNDVVEEKSQEVITPETDLSADSEGNQLESDNSRDEVSAINGSKEPSYQEQIASLKEKWSLDSEDEVLKKLVNLEKHNSKLQNENKELRSISESVAESAQRLEESVDPSLDSVKGELDHIFAPVKAISQTKRQEEQDKLALEDFISKNPEAVEFKNQLWDEARTSSLQYPDLWRIVKNSYNSGISKGAESESAKNRALIGSSSPKSIMGQTESRKLTPEQIRMAQRFGNDPKEVYGV